MATAAQLGDKGIKVGGEINSNFTACPPPFAAFVVAWIKIVSLIVSTKLTIGKLFGNAGGAIV